MVEAEDLARAVMHTPGRDHVGGEEPDDGVMSIRLIRCARLRAKGIASSGQNSSSASAPTWKSTISRDTAPPGHL